MIDNPASDASVLLEVDSLHKQYVNKSGVTAAIREITFDVRASEFVSIVGPSGCGKTTLLKCMSGLLAPTSGRTRLLGETIVKPPKDLAVVFQDYSRSLLPWYSVRKNVALPLRHKQIEGDVDAIVDNALAAVSLDAFADHHPWQLSGGMQQRVAIARAVAYRPRVLLMDEPFASVDAQTRADLEDLVLRVREEFGITIVLVTHDIDEAVYMSDRVAVLSRPPSVVQEIHSVTFPEPRDQISTKMLPEFGAIRSEIYRAVTQSKPQNV